MAKDKDYIKLIHTERWLLLRRDTLTARPLCEQCKQNGLVVPATEVHHHTPVEYGVSYADKVRLMYDPTNLRALCHDCHVKMHTQMGRSGKDATRRRNDEHLQRIVKKYFE